MRLSVIIPSYDGEKRLGKTLPVVFDYLSKQSYDWEVIVVSDGSKDKTAEVAQAFAVSHPGFSVIVGAENYGKGYAVREGMLKAQGDFRLFTDDDNSTSIEQIEKFWPYLDRGYNIVIGSIEVPGAKIFEHAQWYRRMMGHYSKLIIRIVAGLWGIRDTQRGFKCFTAKSTQDIFSRAKINRFAFDIEVLAIAKKLGYKVKEVPVVWDNPKETKVRLTSYFQVLKDLFKIRFWLWFNVYGIKNS